MPQNIFEGMQKENQSGSRNKFNSLSHVTTYSSKCGMLLPALCLETVPNDYFEIKVSDILRTLPFQQAAFAGLHYNLDFYFVPYSYLWSSFPQMIVGRRNSQSNFVDNNDIVNKCPYIRLVDLIESLMQQSELEDWTTSEMFDAFRLMDLLGYGNYSSLRGIADIPAGVYTATINDVDETLKVNVFRALAYQKIFSDHYRNPYFDTQVKPSTFNIDSVVTESSLDLTRSVDTLTIRDWFRIHQAPYRKDLHTSVLPSDSFGPVSSVSINGNPFTGLEVNTAINDFETLINIIGETDTNSYYSDASTPRLNVGTNPNGNGYIGSYDGTTYLGDIHHHHVIDDAYEVFGSLGSFEGEITGTPGSQSFDVLQLVRAQAAQEWAYNTLRNGNRLSSAWKGHFGTTPDYSKDHISTYLGSYSSEININTVTSTGDSDGAVLGAQAATGVTSLHGDTIKFQSNDFGIIMAISSIVPDIQYSSSGLHPNNSLIDQFDFYAEEFDNTGLVPVPSCDFETLDSYYHKNVVGYAPLWYNYKVNNNLSHGDFARNRYIGGTKSPFVVEAPSAASFNQEIYPYARAVESFYVWRGVDRYLFNANTEDPHQTSDPYMHHIYFDIMALRKMSKLGLPNF